MRTEMTCKPAKESVGKISLCTSPCSPCLRGASFLKQFQHGDTEITESTRRSLIFPTDSEGGDRNSQCNAEICRPLRGLRLVFWPLFPAMNRWAIIDRPFT